MREKAKFPQVDYCSVKRLAMWSRRTSTKATTCLTARPGGVSKHLSGKCCQLASLDFLPSTFGINEAELRNLFGKLLRPYRGARAQGRLRRTVTRLPLGVRRRNRISTSGAI